MNLEISVEETVDKKFSDKMKASEVLEEVFAKCHNCGKNFKIEQGFRDHCDKAHQNWPNSHKYEWTNAIPKTSIKKGLKQHHKMKHTSSQYKKVGNLFKDWACDKAEITLKGLYYQSKQYHNNKQICL